jgi:hypothetical protein
MQLVAEIWRPTCVAYDAEWCIVHGTWMSYVVRPARKPTQREKTKVHALYKLLLR